MLDAEFEFIRLPASGEKRHLPKIIPSVSECLSLITTPGGGIGRGYLPRCTRLVNFTTGGMRSAQG